MGFTIKKGSEKGFWEGGFQKVARTPPWRVRPNEEMAKVAWRCGNARERKRSPMCKCRRRKFVDVQADTRADVRGLKLGSGPWSSGRKNKRRGRPWAKGGSKKKFDHHRVLEGDAHRGAQFYFSFLRFSGPFFHTAKWAFSALKLAPPWRQPLEALLEIRKLQAEFLFPIFWVRFRLQLSEKNWRATTKGQNRFRIFHTFS